MNIVDISSHQQGIDLATVFASNPLDGVIVKATEGTGYQNEHMRKWSDWLLENGKPLGFYHYLKCQDPHSEAAYFVNTVRPYLGKAILAADYEAEALRKGTKYLKNFLDTVTELTGVRPLVYCSQSVIPSQDFSEIAKSYKLWMAQYADMNPCYGFKENPWHSGSVSPFSGYVMHQYSGKGRLNGYDGDIDLDLFNGSYSMWCELAKGEEHTLKPADPDVCLLVLSGFYGIGEERVRRLTEAGYDAQSVQSMINTLYGIAISCKTYMNGYEDYSESIAHILKVL